MKKLISVGSMILLGLYFVVLFVFVGDFNSPQPGGELPITNFLVDPVTEIAKKAQGNFWYTCLHMLPYFVISEGLLIFAIFRFKAKQGRVAATFHENLKLEVFWTLVPFISVIFIAWPTYDILEFINTAPKSDLEVKVTGQRFQFRYNYLEHDIDLVDEPLVVPANKNVTLLMTSVDVIHSYWVPAFGVKYDLVPGRMTQIWFNVDRVGFYKGQCAEICGENHAKMMIWVEVKSQEDFDAWLAEKKQAALTTAMN